MKPTTQTIIKQQLLASLATLKQCVDTCPKEQIHEKHKDYPFSQVVFHALFYCDFYLSESKETFFKQDFHIKYKNVFDDYEELEDRLPTKLYEIAFLNQYVEHCRGKIEKALDEITDMELMQNSKMRKNEIVKEELFIDLCRHMQHHAAQLGLRIQVLTGKELQWITSGWKEF